MSYTFKQNLVSSSKYSIKCPYSMTPIGFCIHNTSNDASAENEIKYMISNNNQVSFHYAVDEKYVIQGVPTNRNCWASGDGNGNGNRKHIHIEICRSTGDLETFKKCEQNCAEFLAKELKKRGWGIDRVKKHQDFASKRCPHRTLDLGWTRFLNMIQKELDKLNGKTTTTTTTISFNVGDKVVVKSSATTYADSTKIIPSWVKGGLYTISKISDSKVLLKEIVSWVKTSDVKKSGTSSKSVSYVIRVTVDFLNIRSGAGTNFPVTGTVKKGGVYTIVEEKNGFGKLKSGAGWISLDCTEKVK